MPERPKPRLLGTAICGPVSPSRNHFPSPKIEWAWRPVSHALETGSSPVKIASRLMLGSWKIRATLDLPFLPGYSRSGPDAGDGSAQWENGPRISQIKQR
jgi:hypothetical protein